MSLKPIDTFRSAHRLSFGSNAHSIPNSLFTLRKHAMARRYSRGAQRKVKKVMKEHKRGKLKSGRSALTASTSRTEEIFL